MHNFFIPHSKTAVPSDKSSPSATCLQARSQSISFRKRQLISAPFPLSTRYCSYFLQPFREFMYSSFRNILMELSIFQLALILFPRAELFCSFQWHFFFPSFLCSNTEKLFPFAYSLRYWF